MCGITGLYNYHYKTPVDRKLAAEMTRAIMHRGPDDHGLYFYDEAGVFLGHRRLSIIDLSTGQQPMCNEDKKVWIVFNGEIYNFKDLRRDLESSGHVFKTHSDTETIIHAFEKSGVNSLPALNGMFGFAVWDENERTLLLARDPFGIKPLYFYDNGKTLIFGSEIKSILCHPLVKREVDAQGLSDFMTLTYVPSPGTAFSGIKKVLPGHAVICTPDGLCVQRFYKKPPMTDHKHTERYFIDELRSGIVDSIKRQMVADVPIGAMLSGGVDSSTLATIMTEISGGGIKTFTVGFEGDFKYNELEPARAVARRIRSDHHDLVISSDDFDKLLPHSIWHLEEPVSTASTLPFYMICKLAHEHVKVVLTGQGADEPFAGYPRHLGERYGKYYRMLPEVVRDKISAPLIEKLPRNEQLKRAARSLSENNSIRRFVKVYDTLDSYLKKNLFRDGLLGNNGKSRLQAVQLWQSDVRGLDSLSQMLYVDSRLSLPDNLLMYSDKMSMAVSLEARVPFLDLELMKIVEGIPSHLKIKQKTQKYILKKAAAKWIPKDVIYRKKIGFGTPIDGWFQKELFNTLEERLLSIGSGCNYYLKPETIRKMINDHQNKIHDYKRPLFSLLTFEIWYEQFIKPSQWVNINKWI